MPRTRKAAAKKAPSPKPEPKVTGRRTRNSLKAQLEASNNEEDNRDNPKEENTVPPTKSLGRQTRSRKSGGGGSNDVAEPVELPIRKRQKRAKPQDEAPARKSARGKQKPQEVEVEEEVIPESEPEAESEGGDDEPTDAFFKSINQSLFLEGERSAIASAGQDEDEDEDEPEKSHDTAQAETQELEAHNDQTEPVPSSPSKHSKPGRRGRRRQSKKAAYGESEGREAREASVELGADIPSAKKRRPAPEEKQVDEPAAEPTTGNEENNDRDVYEIDEDESADEEEQRDVPKSSKFTVDTDDDEDEDEDDEPENGNATMVGEDSLFISAPTEENKVILTDIASKWISKITSLMKVEGWTGTKKWTHNFTIPKGKTKDVWLNRQERHLHPDQFRVLFRHLYGLWEICHEMPRAPAFKSQFEYWKERESDLGKSTKIIRSVVEDISKNMQVVFAVPVNERNDDSEWGDLALDILCIKIIPMVVYILEESFKVGGAVTLGSGEEVGMSDKCRFTSTTLQLPLLIVGWLQRLYTVVAVQISVDFPEKEGSKVKLRRKHAQRKRLEGHLKDARGAIQQGMDQLDYLAEAPQREMEAKEKKQALDLAREKQEEEQREADARRMELFVKSIRRMNGSAPIEPRPPSRDDYSERHEGWQYHEDDALLSMIRKIRNPNPRALSPLVPDRSEEEIVQRVSHLRERMRIKYEGKGEVPPLWCFPPS